MVFKNPASGLKALPIWEPAKRTATPCTCFLLTFSGCHFLLHLLFLTPSLATPCPLSPTPSPTPLSLILSLTQLLRTQGLCSPLAPQTQSMGLLLGQMGGTLVPMTVHTAPTCPRGGNQLECCLL